ncbi:MAG: sulfatase-like hydrolase/transferase [Planctomycetota bacterium]
MRLIRFRLAAVLFCSVLATNASARPNVIVVFVDDLSWPDLGCQEAVDDIRTPHLDDLAARGVRLTSGYVTAPQCSPSRAGLLTGRYQQRFDFDHIGMCPLPLSETLFAEMLRDAGYATGMVGKWHLEPNHTSKAWASRQQPPVAIGKGGRVRLTREMISPYLPDVRGFDDIFKGEMSRYWANYGLDGRSYPEPRHEDHPGYRLDLQTDAAVQFIRRRHEGPFYLHLAYFAPHVPLEATPRYPRAFSRSDAGAAPLRPGDDVGC